MIVDHSNFEQPAGDAQMWRYMDFAKFVSLLNTSCLYFARADQMEDPYESALPRQYVERLKARYKTANNNQGFRSFLTEMRSQLYLSCWYMASHESAAMWKLYCGQGDGIAICSTMTKIKLSFQNAEEMIMAGKVHYIDYSLDDFKTKAKYKNALSGILHKRKSFEHEQEVRLVIWGTQEQSRQYNKLHGPPAIGDTRQHDPLPIGFSVKCDLKEMISKVMVSPTARAWFRDVVVASLDKFGYGSIPIEHSSLYEKPIY